MSAPAGLPPDDIAVRGSVEPPAVMTEAPAALSPMPKWTWVGVGVGMLAIIASVAALHVGRAFFVPLLIGILASYTLRPVVDWLQRYRIPRAVAAAMVLAVLVGGSSWIGVALREDVSTMVEKLPDTARKLRRSLVQASRSGSLTALQNVQEAASELQAAAADAGAKPGVRPAPPPPSDSGKWLRDYAVTQSALLLSIAAQAPIVLLLTYFLLASGTHFRRKLVQFVGPSLARKKETVRILEEIDMQIQRYLLVMLLSNAFVGVATWLAFEAIGLRHAGVWGIFAGVMHFVPYLGPALVATCSAIAGFLQFGTLSHAAGLAGVATLIAGLIGMGFMTWLQGRFARVHTAVLFIALLFFGWLWGVAGLLLGAPLVAIVKVVCDRVESLKLVGELLGR